MFSLIIAFTNFNAQNPINQWHFEKSEFSATSDSLKGLVEYVEGTTGKALVFDGYSTELIRMRKDAVTPENSFTISAWVAPQEYSWNLTAIINQQIDFQKGYFFGINQIGQLVGSMAMDSGWKSCISEKCLPLLKWSHVSMVFDAKKGILIFINGDKAGESRFSGRPLYADSVDICIGKTQKKMTPALTERKTSKAVVSWMYFDGLMDELTNL